MRLYGIIEKVEPLDDGTVRVHGIASTEDRDDQGEIVRASAMAAALPDYMKFPAIREMHQLSAAGTALEAHVGEDRVTRIVAHVVDPIAVAKVKTQTYRGFSIGGRVTERDPADYKTITGVVLNEISLVDRPANPEAVFDCWKAAKPAAGGVMPEPFNPPLQIWACGVPEHRHVAKAEALRCMAKAAVDPVVDQIRATIDGAYAAAAELEDAAARAEALKAQQHEAAKGGDDPGDGSQPYGDEDYADPGYQPDKKKRYPLTADGKPSEDRIRAAWNYIHKKKDRAKYTTEQVDKIEAKIVAAWKAHIDKDGPPAADDKDKAAMAAIHKALADVGGVAQVILGLDWLKDLLETEAAMEGDDSPQPARLQAIIAELCGFLNALVAEETAEVIAGDEVDPLAVPYGIPYIDGIGLAAVSETLRKSGKGELAVALEKATQHEAAMIHMAHHAVAKATEMPGLGDEKMGHLHAAKLSLAAAAGMDGTADEHSTVDTAGNPTHPAPTAGGPDPTGAKAARAAAPALHAIGALAKHGGHQALMDVAHDCIKDATGGAVCGAMKAHSAEMMAHLHKAHLHLVAAGAKCDAGIGANGGEHQGAEMDGAKAAAAHAAAIKDLQARLAESTAEKAELIKSLAAITATLGNLSKRVEDIANTPLPPAAVARLPGGTGPRQPTEAEIDAAWKAMTPDERALLGIAGALRRPYTAPGAARIAERPAA